MRYDVLKPQAPSMPNLGRGTECIKILLSQASKDMQKPLISMLFSSLGAQMAFGKFQHYDIISSNCVAKWHIKWQKVR